MELATTALSNFDADLLDFNTSFTFLKKKGGGGYKDGQVGDSSILVLAEDVMVPVSVVYNAISILKKEGVAKLDPVIVTQASTQSKFSLMC
ncbi:hypothetical protein RND71_016114 [Anisodus tanguticus]|uniref:Uncharacterized protein n=1 Tax=Anisodus tanguticus TaxID=243964 RepID=A0AAE1S7J7_9SOLA|nr:hypothetical protein RND71_016114 [Anisodus tanguticus]